MKRIILLLVLISATTIFGQAPNTTYAPQAYRGDLHVLGNLYLSGTLTGTTGFNGPIGGTTPAAGTFTYINDVNREIECPVGTYADLCVTIANNYTTSAETGGSHGVILKWGDYHYHVSPSYVGPQTVNNGIVFEGVQPRFIATGNSAVSSGTPNGGTWIDFNGNPGFIWPGTATTGVSAASLHNVGFFNWSNTLLQFGSVNTLGCIYCNLTNVYASGQCTANQSDQGVVFYNSLFTPMNHVSVMNVNTAYAFISSNSASGAITPGNSVLIDLFTQPCNKTAAAGNNTEPGILVKGVTPPINMLTFIRPQVNQGGDGTADQMLISNAGSIGITDGDFEGPAANGVHLVGSYANRIGIVESWGQTNTVTVDSTSTGNEIDCLGNCALNIDPAQKYTTAVLGNVSGLNGAIPSGPIPNQFVDIKANTVQKPNSRDFYIGTVSLPTSTGSNNAVLLGTLALTQSSGSLITMTAHVFGNSCVVIDKTWIIPWPGTGQGLIKVPPLMDSGAYSGSNFDLDISASGTSINFYFIRTGGTCAANAYVSIAGATAADAIGSTGDYWTTSGTVSTQTAATSIYGPSSITVAAGGLTVGGRCGSGDGATIECNDAPVINYPPNGSTLTGSTQVFSWPAVPGATGYYFWLGTTAGGNDLLNGNSGTNTYITASGLPTAGATIYASLYAVQTTGTNKVATATYTAASPIYAPQKVVTCGTTTTCSNTAQTSPRIVWGTVALSSGSATVTGMSPAWTSTTSFSCTGTDTTSAAAVKIVNASTSSITVTGTGTDVINYHCIGN